MNRPSRILTACLALIGGLAVDAQAASAHGDDGSIAIDTQTAGDGLSVTYGVRVTYLNDADPAAGATVTAAADGPNGATVGPIPLAPTDRPGHYVGTITYPTPGSWELRISSLSPTATITAPVTITASSSTTLPATTPAPPAAPATDAANTPTPTTAESERTASTNSVDVQSTAAPTTEVSGSDSGNSAGLLVGLVIAAVVIAAGVAVALVRRRRGSAD